MKHLQFRQQQGICNSKVPQAIFQWTDLSKRPLRIMIRVGILISCGIESEQVSSQSLVNDTIVYSASLSTRTTPTTLTTPPLSTSMAGHSLPTPQHTAPALPLLPPILPWTFHKLTNPSATKQRPQRPSYRQSLNLPAEPASNVTSQRRNMPVAPLDTLTSANLMHLPQPER